LLWSGTYGKQKIRAERTVGKSVGKTLPGPRGEFQLEEQNLLALYMQLSDSTIASIVLLPPTS
jgi:hypothetical protein